jgi:hypothetical protein
MGKVRKFTCVKCGTILEVHPPDSVHKYASRDERYCERGIKVEHKCEKCGNLNTIFWCNFVIPAWYA